MADNKFFIEDIDVMRNPNFYYEDIKTIEDTMARCIHSLICGNGKKVKDNYVLNLYNKSWGAYCKIIDNGGNCLQIKKAIVINPQDCQIMGHIFLEDTDGKRYEFSRLYHQEMNVYSHIYHLIKQRRRKEYKEMMKEA